MIQIYKASNTNYDYNGDATLNPTSCILNMKLNDIWELQMKHPIDDKLPLITENAVISAPTPLGKKQLFRIYDFDKTDDEIICTAYPIFLDSRNDCFLFDVRPTNKKAKDALDLMLASNNKYSATSNISKASTSYFVRKNFMEALCGDDKNSFINRWGGEFAFNNYQIIVNERLGADNGLRVEFGFNLNGISEKVDMSNVITRIVPKAYNGYILPNEETVDSPNINKYPIVYIKEIEYQDVRLKEDATEGDAEKGIIVCDTLEILYQELRKKAKEEYEKGVDLPSITYDVDMIDLSKTDVYKDYQGLTKVNLGDTAHIKHKRLDITTTARIIELEYDCTTEEISNLVLGDFEENYFNDKASIINSASKVIDISNNTLMAEKISGIINMLNTSMRAQKDIAQRQDVRSILFEDLNKDSQTYGALCIGTQGIQIARKRNETDTDWQWGTAINFESIIADYIITGIISDKLGKFYLNLDTGELRMKDGTFIGKIKGGTIEIGNNFSVDENGNAKMNDGVFTGKIMGGTIRIGNNFSVDENGNAIAKNINVESGVFKGNIETTENAKIGKNLYIGEQSEYGKTIYFNKDAYIMAYMLSSAYPFMNITINGISFKIDNDGIRYSNNGKTFYINASGTSRFDSLDLSGNISIDGNTTAKHISCDSLYCEGSKKRVVQTEHYGMRGLNAVESAECLFTDSGKATMNAAGTCRIDLDKIWLETVSTEKPYYVFLSACSIGNVYCAKKEKDYFIVKGTPNMEFNYMVQAKQKGYENERLMLHRKDVKNGTIDIDTERT